MANMTSHALTDLESELSGSSQSSPMEKRRQGTTRIGVLETGASSSGSAAELAKLQQPAEPLRGAADASTSIVSQAVQKVVDSTKAATDAVGLTKPADTVTAYPALIVPVGVAAPDSDVAASSSSLSPGKQTIFGRLFGRRTNDQDVTPTTSAGTTASTTVEPSSSAAKDVAPEADTASSATSPAALPSLGGVATKLPGGSGEYLDTAAKAVKDVAATKLDAGQAAQVGAVVDKAAEQAKAILPGAASDNSAKGTAEGGKASESPTGKTNVGESKAAGALGVDKLVDDASKAVVFGTSQAGAQTTTAAASASKEESPTVAAAAGPSTSPEKPSILGRLFSKKAIGGEAAPADSPAMVPATGAAAGVAGMLAAGAAAIGVAAAKQPEGGSGSGMATQAGGGGLDQYVDQAAAHAGKLMEGKVPEGQAKQAQQVLEKAAAGAKAALKGKDLKDLPGMVGLQTPGAAAASPADGSVSLTSDTVPAKAEPAASVGQASADRAAESASAAVNDPKGIASAAASKAKDAAEQVQAAGSDALTATKANVPGTVSNAAGTAQQAAKDTASAASAAAGGAAMRAGEAAEISTAAAADTVEKAKGAVMSSLGTATEGAPPVTQGASSAAQTGAQVSAEPVPSPTAAGGSIFSKLAAAVGLSGAASEGAGPESDASARPALTSLEKEVDQAIVAGKADQPKASTASATASSAAKAAASTDAPGTASRNANSVIDPDPSAAQEPASTASPATTAPVKAPASAERHEAPPPADSVKYEGEKTPIQAVDSTAVQLQVGSAGPAGSAAVGAASKPAGTAADAPLREDQAPGIGGERAPSSTQSKAAAVEHTDLALGGSQAAQDTGVAGAHVEKAAAVLKSSLAAEGLDTPAVMGTVDQVTAATKAQLAGAGTNGRATDAAKPDAGAGSAAGASEFVDQVADAVKSSVITKHLKTEHVSQAVDSAAAAAKKELDSSPTGPAKTSPPPDAAKSSCFCFPRRAKA